MTELESILARLSLSQYLGRLIEEGFEKWETVLDITENDLAFLNFKLGHRRILQREIASARGISPGQPLANSCLHSADDSFEYEDKSSPKPYKGDFNKATPTGKRKYKRHPKPDEHAPEKPPSAYVMFANHIRDELKGQSLTFTDIAKLVGEKWKLLDTHHKEGYELDATRAKTKYNMDLAEYKKTDEYREYLQYLAEFRNRTANEGSEPSENRKRPKLEALPAAGSSSSAATTTTVSSSGSIGAAGGTAGSFPSTRPATAASSGRLGSISSVTTNTSNFPSPTSQSPSMNSTSLPAHMPPPPSPDSSPTPGIMRYREQSKSSHEQLMEHSISHPNSLPNGISSAHDMEPISLPRIHAATVHNPHIQQHLSYSRHQSQPTPPPPPPMGAPSSSPSSSAYTRSSAAMPVPIQPVRRAEDVRMANGPGTPSMDDNSRGSHHRALPFPTPSCQHTSGYFDQRSHHQLSPSRSPRSLSYPPLPGPTQYYTTGR
ncbi:hypothetical protein DFH27DRAFT_32344 [Peziza echinospora]|nr:hypothetical protein DFH27DRAFT_32344 [Peziza echinospora]